jgi:hypothetical protein
MGLAMEVISGYAVNASTTLTALTMGSGDSNVVRSFSPTSGAWLLDQWAQGATKGYIRTISPRLHDNVYGVTLAYAAALPVPLWPEISRELLYPQDTLGLYISGDASDTDGMSSLVYYQDLPGTAANLQTLEAVKSRMLHQSGVQLALTTGGTKGNYGGATAINATANQFKANTDYAILGYVTDTAVQTIRIKSSDFGNLGVGGPGTNNKIETRDWFSRLSVAYQMPMIPVFNAANVSNTIVDLICNTTGTAVVVTFMCAELRTPGGAQA